MLKDLCEEQMRILDILNECSGKIIQSFRSESTTAFRDSVKRLIISLYEELPDDDKKEVLEGIIVNEPYKFTEVRTVRELDQEYRLLRQEQMRLTASYKSQIFNTTEEEYNLAYDKLDEKRKANREEYEKAYEAEYGND